MRKVLSFVLVLTMVLGSFSMAFAATPAAPAGLSDIAGNANIDAINVAYDLGIVTGNPDGTFLPAKAVNRAEFAAMLTRALAVPDSALAGYTSTSFKDTAGYGWAVPYLAFAQSKGIMLGDGAGNAMPGRTITVNEAVTMALRAIGYTANSAELVGVWPSNYVTLAQNKDLYDDVAATGNVDKANAAQIVYNLLTVQKVAVNSDGKTDPLWIGKESDDKPANLLTTGLGCEISNPMILTNSNTEDAKINMTPYLGAYAVVYTDDDKIVAVGELKSTFLTGDYDSEDNELTVGDVTYTNVTDAAVTSDAIYFTNAEEDGDDSAVADALTTDGTITVAVDLSGKKVKEIYSLNVWDVQANESQAFLYEDGDLDMTDYEINGIAFPQNDDDVIDYNKFILDGVSSLDKIAKDNVVYAYTNSDNEITRLAVGTKAVTGKVTKSNADGDEFTIAGTKYDLADPQDSTPAVGETGTAYLDFSGAIYSWDADDASSGNYAIVLARTDENAADMTDGKVKLMTKEGDEKTFVVDADDVDETTLTALVTKGSLVEYSLDKDGKVDELKVKTINTATSGAVDRGELSASGKVFDGKSVDAGVVVFTYDGTDYDTIALADVERDANLYEGAHYVGTYTPADGKIEVMIIDSENTNADKVYAVINTVDPAVNDDDEDVQYVEGFAGGKAFAAYTDDKDLFDAPEFTSGTIYVLDVDANGVVTDATPLVEADGADTEAFLTGEITDKDGTYNVAVDDNFVTIDSKAVVYELNLDDEEYSLKSVSSLKEHDVVYMWQADEDSEQYDVIVYVRP